MTLSRIIAALVASVAITPSAAAGAASQQTAVSGSSTTSAAASVSVGECTSGLVATERRVAFVGRMRSIAGASRMQMKFELQSSGTAARSSWRTVDAAGFGVWSTAASGVDAYTYTKRVENLLAPARYRAVVRFRWLDSAGRVLRRREIVSRVCRQPDLRPDLVADGVTIEPVEARPGSAAAGTPDRAEGMGHVRYVVPVSNNGRASAPDFEMVLVVNGDALPPVAVTGLAPKEERAIAVEGPRCRPGTQILVTLDPAGNVAERDERDNVIAVSCA